MLALALISTAARGGAHGGGGAGPVTPLPLGWTEISTGLRSHCMHENI